MMSKFTCETHLNPNTQSTIMTTDGHFNTFNNPRIEKRQRFGLFRFSHSICKLYFCSCHKRTEFRFVKSWPVQCKDETSHFRVLRAPFAESIAELERERFSDTRICLCIILYVLVFALRYRRGIFAISPLFNVAGPLGLRVSFRNGAWPFSRIRFSGRRSGAFAKSANFSFLSRGPVPIWVEVGLLSISPAACKFASRSLGVCWHRRAGPKMAMCNRTMTFKR